MSEVKNDLVGFVHLTGIYSFSARELCRQIAAYILSKLTPFLLVWGVRKGGLGGGWSIWAGGPKFTRNRQKLFLRPGALWNQHLYTHIQTRSHKYTHTRTHIQKNTHTHTNTHTHAYSHTHAYTHTQTHTRTHIHSLTRMHTHIHTPNTEW